MFVELGLFGAGMYYLSTIKEREIKRKWNQIMESDDYFKNKLGKTIKMFKLEFTEYGYDIIAELPYSFTQEDLKKAIDVFIEGLSLADIELLPKNNMCIMKCVEKLEFEDYKPIPLPPNVLLIARSITGSPIWIDMNSFPHALIGGSTGTGKSRLLFTVLTNLIANTSRGEVEIHLLQRRKNDLEVFENCQQVSTSAKTLEDICNRLQAIDKECMRREAIIRPSMGVYNIADYNKENKYNKLKYVYVVIEEFSFLQIDQGDSESEKALKKRCLKCIKTIVNVGRSSGVFLITALQKPTNSSIPSDIKDQLTTRVSMKIIDAPASMVVLGDASATYLGERECIIKTLNTNIATSYTINHEIIMENIKSKQIVKKKKQVPVVQKSFESRWNNEVD